MPNRILKESICYSENIEKLTQFQEIFFYRLIVNCDDYGRMDARPKVLGSKLFPLRDVRMNQISDALQALASAELVVLYEEDGHPFLQMKTWDRHQTIRAKKSKYPAPDDNMKADDFNCKQMQADDFNCKQMQADDFNCKQMISDASICSRNPIQSNPNPYPNPNTNPNPNPNPTRTREAQPKNDSLFNLFWAAYPRKEGKENARKAFDKLKPDDELMRTMLDAIEKQKGSAQWKENGGQFIPYPASWLNGKRWEDEIRPIKIAPVKTVSAQQYEQRDDDPDAEVWARQMEEIRRMQNG